VQERAHGWSAGGYQSDEENVMFWRGAKTRSALPGRNVGLFTGAMTKYCPGVVVGQVNVEYSSRPHLEGTNQSGGLSAWPICCEQELPSTKKHALMVFDFGSAPTRTSWRQTARRATETRRDHRPNRICQPHGAARPSSRRGPAMINMIQLLSRHNLRPAGTATLRIA